MNLEDLCSVKQEDIDSLFDDFFIIRNINQKNIIKKLDLSKIYSNYEIKKIEIKNGLDYQQFIYNLLVHFLKYHYDGNRGKKFTIGHQKAAYKNINEYSPKFAIELEKFNQTNIPNIGKKGINFDYKKNSLQCKKEEQKNIIFLLKQNMIKDVLDIDQNKTYIILSKNNNIIKRTGKQILGHLHGDIGEFILFILVEGILKKPILFSKIYHSKSNFGDKIKGSDGIHISSDNGKPKLLFLEAKLRNNFNLCIDDAIESQLTLLDTSERGGLANEINIIHPNIITINESYQHYFGDFFDFIDPYYNIEGKENRKDLPFDLCVGLFYELKNYKNIFNEDDTIKRIQMVLEKYKSIEGDLKGKKVSIFLMPLLDNEELIKIFLDQTETP